jgi:NADH-quinone oxidoreductase subunit C
LTESPSEAVVAPDATGVAQKYAALVGSDAFSADFGTAKVRIPADRWVEAHRTLSEHLPYFSWLSAIDWANEVAVGDPPDGEVEERFEVMSCLGSASSGEWMILSTDIAKDGAALPTLRDVFGGADWHEREAHEMFGITFTGHPNLTHLYLPDSFEGNPLRKTFPLLSREVKPWPGMVDVEDLPSTENAEAGDDTADDDEGGDE